MDVSIQETSAIKKIRQVVRDYEIKFVCLSTPVLTAYEVKLIMRGDSKADSDVQPVFLDAWLPDIAASNNLYVHPC